MHIRQDEDVAADAVTTNATPLARPELDGAAWCRKQWAAMHSRLRRQAADLKKRSAFHDQLAAGISVWTARAYPWAHAARTALRLDAAEWRADAETCRRWAKFASDTVKELDLVGGGGMWTPEVAPGEAGEPPEDIRPARPAIRVAVVRDAPRSDPMAGMAVLRQDLGWPATYELQDEQLRAAGYGRFFRLDETGDWPKVVDVTEEVESMLVQRRAKRAADAAAAEEDRRRQLSAAADKEPMDYLRDKRVGGFTAVVDFIREGKSGERHRSVMDDRGEVGVPAGEVRSPLQQLREGWKIGRHQFAAGEDFAAHFAAAMFDIGKGTDYSQVRGTGGAAAEKVPSTAVEEEREWVFRAMEALGGGASPMAMAVWSIVGAQVPVHSFATSRHFRVPGGGQRWLSVEEAEALVAAGLATLAATMDAAAIEHHGRRHSLKIRVAGSVEVSFLVGSRHFKVVANFAPALGEWVGIRMAPRKATAAKQAAISAGQPGEIRHWCVRAATMAGLAELAISTATAQVKALREDAKRAQEGAAERRLVAEMETARWEAGGGALWF